jgi:hypothetical protein
VVDVYPTPSGNAGPGDVRLLISSDGVVTYISRSRPASMALSVEYVPNQSDITNPLNFHSSYMVSMAWSQEDIFTYTENIL